MHFVLASSARFVVPAACSVMWLVSVLASPRPSLIGIISLSVGSRCVHWTNSTVCLDDSVVTPSGSWFHPVPTLLQISFLLCDLKLQ